MNSTDYIAYFKLLQEYKKQLHNYDFEIEVAIKDNSPEHTIADLSHNREIVETRIGNLEIKLDEYEYPQSGSDIIRKNQ